MFRIVLVWVGSYSAQLCSIYCQVLEVFRKGAPIQHGRYPDGLSPRTPVDSKGPRGGSGMEWCSALSFLPFLLPLPLSPWGAVRVAGTILEYAWMSTHVSSVSYFSLGATSTLGMAFVGEGTRYWLRQSTGQMPVLQAVALQHSVHYAVP